MKLIQINKEELEKKLEYMKNAPKCPNCKNKKLTYKGREEGMRYEHFGEGLHSGDIFIPYSCHRYFCKKCKGEFRGEEQ